MKKLILGAFFLLASLNLFGDINSDINNIYASYKKAVISFCDSIDRDKNNQEYEQTFQVFLKDMQTISQEGSSLEDKYSQMGENTYDQTHDKDWQSLQEQDSKIWARFTATLQKLAQAAQNDDELSNMLEDLSNDMDKLE